MEVQQCEGYGEETFFCKVSKALKPLLKLHYILRMEIRLKKSLLVVHLTGSLLFVDRVAQHKNLGFKKYSKPLAYEISDGKKFAS